MYEVSEMEINELPFLVMLSELFAIILQEIGFEFVPVEEIIPFIHHRFQPTATNGFWFIGHYIAKSSEQEMKAEYYTVKEAMEKFKLSRDSVYGILQFHQINREKNGRFVRFLKVEFDKVMGVRK